VRDFALLALDLIPSAVQYGDVRVVRQRDEHVRVKNGELDAWSDEQSLGFGVRLLVDGYWGFASSADLTRHEAERVVKQALALASAAAQVGGPRAVLAPGRTGSASWSAPLVEDPFSVSGEEKIAMLLSATERLRVSGVTIAKGSIGCFREEKVFASTEGSLVQQTRTEAGAGIAATAVRDGDVQVRSYPSAHGGSWRQGGFEYIRGLDLAGHAGRVGDEAVRLLDAPPCPQSLTTVILDADQMALQVHESVGHPLELDRILGSEASYAGSSFVAPPDLGQLRYGSEAVTILADATVAGGLGTFAYDDEGQAARREVLIDRGRLAGFLSSRETGAVVGRGSSGAMRASSWSRLPLVRMTNINLEPGEWQLEELIADTREGLFLSTNKSWSIDDRRLNFHFGTEIGWEIKDGCLGRMLRDCTYSATTPRFWGACDAVCGQSEWRLYGLTNCGKGEPGQEAHVGHGVSPARFRDVSVAAAR
jgi:TldD protein